MKVKVKRKITQVVGYVIEARCPYCHGDFEMTVDSLGYPDCHITKCPKCGAEIHILDGKLYRREDCPGTVLP